MSRVSIKPNGDQNPYEPPATSNFRLAEPAQPLRLISVLKITGALFLSLFAGGCVFVGIDVVWLLSLLAAGKQLPSEEVPATVLLVGSVVGFAVSYLSFAALVRPPLRKGQNSL